MRAGFVVPLAVAVLVATSSASYAADPEGTREAALAGAVKAAITRKDAAALDGLVYWEGAGDSGRKFFRALLETALETTVEAVEVVPLPPGKTGPPTTLPVTHLLRITGSQGEMSSRQSFPVGEKDGRLYLVCAMEAPAGLE